MIDIPDSIFPTDEKGDKVCPKCRHPLKECTCQSYDPNRTKTENFRPRVRLEKKGRRGKSVTVILGLPPEESYLKDLTRRLKSAAASGGTCYIADGEGVIEIQGDQQDAAQRILSQENFSR